MDIRSLTVTPHEVEAVVAFERGEPLRTSEAPGAAERVLAVLPGLKGHRCDNDAGATFADEVHETELAHLLEHAALEIMAMAGSPHTLRGSTAWDFAADGAGVFRVRLDYDDDLVALGALKAASGVVRWAVGAPGSGTEPPDVVAEAARLRGMRTP